MPKDAAGQKRFNTERNDLTGSPIAIEWAVTESDDVFGAMLTIFANSLELSTCASWRFGDGVPTCFIHGTAYSKSEPAATKSGK